jgi:hypothetical protein
MAAYSFLQILPQTCKNVVALTTFYGIDVKRTIFMIFIDFY